jgi:anti-sigma factor RsiW
MTAPDTPDLPGPWPDVLAAYADGELDPAARAVVGRWLACRPGACDELRAQCLLSAENWPLWQQAEPPLPTETAWAGVCDAIAAAVSRPATPVGPPDPPAGRRWRSGRVLMRGLAAAAAGVAFLAVVPFFSPPHPTGYTPPPGDPDPLAGVGTLSLATAGDVDIQRVAGNAAVWLPIGEPPLSGPLVLAGEGDVELEGADVHPAWPAGGPRITTAPGDAPMIFAANPR